MAINKFSDKYSAGLFGIFSMKFLVFIYGASPTSDNSNIIFICAALIQPTKIQLLKASHDFLIFDSFAPIPQITKRTRSP